MKQQNEISGNIFNSEQMKLMKLISINSKCNKKNDVKIR